MASPHALGVKTWRGAPRLRLEHRRPLGAARFLLATTTSCPHNAIMVEHHGQGEHAFGWTFQVSYRSIEAASGDRLYESPYHVGIADLGEAKATP